MSYNTTTISNVFSFLYTPLRRVYSQYAANYSGRQYFLFANVQLKRPDRIPYYFSVEGARIKNNPDGYLPTDISPYYFRERPIYFYDQAAFVDSRVAGRANSYDIKSNPPYIILNLFLNGSYRDIYVNYDSAKMNLTLYAMDNLIFVTEENSIRELQKVLNDVIRELSIAYNQVRLLEQAKAGGKYANDNFLYRDKYGAKVLVEKWISSLQNDARFVVKVCRECNNNAQLGSVFVPLLTAYITMVGAVSLSWLSANFAQYDHVKNYLDGLLIEIERLRVDLDVQWKLVNNPGYTATEVDTKPLPTATVTATKKKAVFPWLFFALGLGIVIIDSGDSKKSKQ